MAEQQMISAIASSSNSSSIVSAKKYDVFLSFRGEDTRRSFTSHLYEALVQKKVQTYIDNRLEKGDEISPALTKAIEDSHASVVILSENYASSKWCLDELSKILECKKDKGQIVMPVFYNIDPSQVRKQTGNYEQAFAKHEGDPRCNKWKASLTELANLAGWDSRTYRTEAEFLKDIVEDILQKLAPRYPNRRKGLVGIEESYEQIELLLKIGSSEVKTIGIWGMGGIGKTTLATVLYDTLSYKFEGRCFLANVREKSDKLEALRDELFSKLVDKKPSFDNFNMSMLQRKKVFIVLDDVATSDQIETLIGEYDFLGPGSRVIVTTRDKQILSPVDEIYSVQDLSSNHSLQLFCLIAFGEKQPKDGYEDLSRRVISYCKGVPLALKVLGASLRKRSKEAWESELRKLQEIPNMKIRNVLKLSCDSLDRSEKDIFLDIACFFKGCPRDWVTSLLEACHFFATSGIENLLDKALITISDDNEIEMHDLIQEMGQEIVHQESIKDPGRRTRLWKHEEVLDVLKFNKGTDVLEGIILNLDNLTGDLCLSSDSLAKMTNMRILILCEGYGNRFNVYLPNGLESLPNKLRCLWWDGYCLESLSSNFCAEQLVELHMPNSKLKKLWDGVQNLVNLMLVNLKGSQDLIEIPDLSKAEKLEIVRLRNCESLCQLPPSKLSFAKLTILDLRGCREIESLNVHSKSLRKLKLGGCSSLKEISMTSDKIKKLDLYGCRVIESLNVHSKSLCELIVNCSSLKEFSVSSEEMTELDISNCRAIEILNVHSKSLFEVQLGGCSSLKEISMTSEEIEELDLSHCRAIESLHVHAKSLCELGLDDCSSLKEFSVSSEKLIELDLSHSAICALSSSIGHLSSLELLNLSGTNVESLPADIKDLLMLRSLYLDDCRKLVSLPKLPLSLEKLSALNCTSLETEITQRVVSQDMLQSHIPYLHQQYLNNPSYSDDGYFIIPSDHVTYERGFLTAKSSITIPNLPKSHLCGFVYCTILSKGPSKDAWASYFVYQDDIMVGWGHRYLGGKNLISDHALFWYHVVSNFDRISEGCDHFSDISFVFEFQCYDGNGFRHGQERIKECGVFPVYASESGLKLFGSSSKEILERESVAQVSDNESQPREFGVGGSRNENEDDWEQFLPTSKRRTSPE